MFLGGDNHRGFTCSQCGANKSAQLVKKKSVVSVELNYVRGLVVVSPARLWRGRRRARNRSVRDAHMDQLPVSRHLAPTWNESRMATVWVILVCRIISAHTGNPVFASSSLRRRPKQFPAQSQTSNCLCRLFRRLPDIEIVVV